MEYRVSMRDGANFKRDTTEGFTEAIKTLTESPTGITVDLQAWTTRMLDAPPAADYVPNAIVKYVGLQLRDFGSQFYISAADIIWARGAVQSIRSSLKRYSPWFGPIFRLVPAALGVLLTLPVIFILLALAHTSDGTALVATAVGLSLLLLAAIGWLTIRVTNARTLPHTLILLESRNRRWSLVRFALGVTTFLADIAVLVALFIKR